MERRRAFCSDVSVENDEPLAGTASRVDHWLLVEYRGLWARDALAGSGLSGRVKAHLRARAAARTGTKLLLVRRTHRRGHPRLAVFWGSTREHGGDLFRAELDAYDELLDLDLTGPGAPVDHPLLLVCTHGKHDPCCARRGRPLYQALEDQAEDGWVWQSSHLGGDRFAGNLVVLPEGLYFGRVGPSEAWPVLDEYLAGRIELDHYRGRACYSFAVQAAERAVREASGTRGLEALALVGCETPVVVFRAGDRLYEVEVVEDGSVPRYLTCSAEALRRPPGYAARILRVSAA